MDVKGIIVAMVTPFDQNQKIDFQATKQLVNKLIADGVYGVFILGTNGEFHLLNNQEKVEFAKCVIDEVAKRVPVYVGTGGNSTAEAIALSKQMEALGADALSVITPYFLVPSQEELIGHYKAVAAAVKIPIVLYNIPKNTGINIAIETVAELAKVDNIIGIKDSSGNIDNIEGYINASKDQDFSVLSGSDSLILKALKVGAKGAIAATANLLTKNDVAIYKNFINNQMEEAEAAQQKIEMLRSVLKLATVPSVLKKSLVLSNMPVGPCRLPVSEPKAEVIPKIKEMLKYYRL